MYFNINKSLKKLNNYFFNVTNNEKNRAFCTLFYKTQVRFQLLRFLYFNVNQGEQNRAFCLLFYKKTSTNYFVFFNVISITTMRRHEGT